VHWLSWKCGDSLHTAREKVRVARGLELLPQTSAAFGRGELSYSKVRALSRIATAETESDLLVMATHETGAGVDRIVSGVRSAMDTADSEDDAARLAWYSRRVERSSGKPGQGEIEVLLPVDSADIVYAAIRADALVQICERVLAELGADVVERGDVGRLSMVVELEALTEDSTGASECTLDGRRVAREVARRWACDVRIDTLVEQASAAVGERHGRDIGRTSRVVPRRLRRAMLRRDHHMCRFPGCGATAWLHAHHIQHWADHGPTDLNNLISVCSFHHHLIHEGGFNVSISDHRVHWTDPDNEQLLIEPVDGTFDPHRHPDIGPNTIQSDWANNQPDHHYIVDVITTHCQRAKRRAGNIPAGTSRRRR
jgi:hypothetical protein